MDGYLHTKQIGKERTSVLSKKKSSTTYIVSIMIHIPKKYNAIRLNI